MKHYYANILGTWTDVTYGCQIVGLMPDDDQEKLPENVGEFVKMFIDDGCHIVHKSMVQVFDDEQREE